MNISDLHNPRAAADVIEDFKRRFSSKVCLSPQGKCEGKIISAHTLSLSLMLRPLSRNGMVYTLISQLLRPDSDPPVGIGLRGLAQTSVFHGFCAKHDKELFSPIEDQQFACSRKQAFLLAFRAVAKEAYLKRRQAENAPKLEDIKKIHGITEDVQLSMGALMFAAASLQGAEEVERLKSRMDAMLLADDFSRLITTVFEFDTPPPISASFVYAPDFDFEGNSLQDFTDFEQDLSHLIVTLFPYRTGGFLLLSHLDTANSAPSRLIASLKQQSDLSSSIAWMIACQTENFAYAPEWYETISDQQRNSLLQGLLVNGNPSDLSVNTLKDRSLTIPDWKFKYAFGI